MKIIKAITRKHLLFNNLAGEKNTQGICLFCGRAGMKEKDNCDYPKKIIDRLKYTKLEIVAFCTIIIAIGVIALIPIVIHLIIADLF